MDTILSKFPFLTKLQMRLVNTTYLYSCVPLRKYVLCSKCAEGQMPRTMQRKSLYYTNSLHANSLAQISLPSLTVLNVFSRAYAKKAKDVKKDHAKRGKVEKLNVELSHEELNEVIDYDKMKTQMEMTVDHLKKEFVEQLSLRTNIGMFETLTVETAEGNFPLNQLGQIVQKNPQLLLINLASSPQYIPNVKTALLSSGMNINAQQDGTTVFIPIPKVTREHRESLAKNAKMLCETTKEKLRNIQNNYSKELKKKKDEFSADLVFNLQETVHATTKHHVEQAESIMKAKQDELLGNN